jgi:predicted GNAT family acetyltransferase
VAEAVPNQPADADMRHRRIAQLLEDGGYWLWVDDGGPVSMTGVSPAPPEGSRIGPVFTPSRDRGRGYATSLVAYVSAHELERGRRACFLHTDLTNPTSNAIYTRIGYRWVCEATDLVFEPEP